MRKIYQILFAFVLVFSVISINGKTVSADPFMSNLVKQEANRHCGISALVVPEDQSTSIIQEDSIVQEASTSSTFSSKIRTSKSGSSIVLSTLSGKNYGYCHIYLGHMKYSNGTPKYSYNGKTQFIYAEFPSDTMDIAMEVINKQDNLIYGGKTDRYYKQIYSSLAGQTVRVVLHRGKSFGYRQDWVIVSMYPRF